MTSLKADDRVETSDRVETQLVLIETEVPVRRRVYLIIGN